MARGHRLNTSIVLAAVHGLSGLFRAASAVEPSLSRNLASVDVKQNGTTLSHPEECIFLCQCTIVQIYRVTPRVLGWGNATRTARTAEQQTNPFGLGRATTR